MPVFSRALRQTCIASFNPVSSATSSSLTTSVSQQENPFAVQLPEYIKLSQPVVDKLDKTCDVFLHSKSKFDNQHIVVHTNKSNLWKKTPNVLFCCGASTERQDEGHNTIPEMNKYLEILKQDTNNDNPEVHSAFYDTRIEARSPEIHVLMSLEEVSVSDYLKSDCEDVADRCPLYSEFYLKEKLQKFLSTAGLYTIIYTDNFEIWKKDKNIAFCPQPPVPAHPTIPGFTTQVMNAYLQKLRQKIKSTTLSSVYSPVIWKFHNTGDANCPQIHIIISSDPSHLFHTASHFLKPLDVISPDEQTSQSCIGRICS